MRAPSFRALKPLLFSALAALAMGTPSLANETVTYICTPKGETPDAVATYETIGGGQVIHLATIKGGNSDAGIYLGDIPPAEFSALSFALQGFPDKAHGPYLIMGGHDKNGTKVTVVADIGKTKSVTNLNDGFWKYKILRDDLGLAQKSFYPDHIFLQTYPGPNDSSSYNFYGFYYNGGSFTAVLGDVNDCFVGTSVP